MKSKTRCHSVGRKLYTQSSPLNIAKNACKPTIKCGEQPQDGTKCKQVPLTFINTDDCINDYSLIIKNNNNSNELCLKCDETLTLQGSNDISIMIGTGKVYINGNLFFRKSIVNGCYIPPLPTSDSIEDYELWLNIIDSYQSEFLSLVNPSNDCCNLIKTAFDLFVIIIRTEPLRSTILNSESVLKQFINGVGGDVNADDNVLNYKNSLCNIQI